MSEIFTVIWIAMAALLIMMAVLGQILGSKLDKIIKLLEHQPREDDDADTG